MIGTRKTKLFISYMYSTAIIVSVFKISPSTVNPSINLYLTDHQSCDGAFKSVVTCSNAVPLYNDTFSLVIAAFYLFVSQNNHDQTHDHFYSTER